MSSATASKKQSPIGYVAITTTEGARFTIRVSRDTAKVIAGIEVDGEGEEVVPAGSGFHNRLRIVPRVAIRRLAEMRMSLVYGRIERAR